MMGVGYALNMTVLTVCCILFVRNWFVHRFLSRLLEAVRETSVKEIEGDDFWTPKKRFRQLDSVGYIELVLVFWKPFRSFYVGKDLIEPLLHEIEREVKTDG